MAYSGEIGGTTFNALKVVDHAFRRCRLPAQAITAEMQSYALDSLYLMLSDMANPRTPSWCIQKQLYPLYEGQYQVTLDTGTVSVLNANLRTMQELDPGPNDTTITSTMYKVDFNSADGGAATVNTVGVKWAAAAVPLTFQVSDDNIVWITVGTQTTTAAAGEWTWTDVVPATAHRYFRFTTATPYAATEVYLGTLPQEIPMGVLNKDTYVAQSNKVFTGRPLTYWFQRDLPRPVMNLWPAPNLAAEHQVLVVWRQRQIMDTQNLRQDVEVPQRWLEAIVNGLAARVAAETPQVDAGLIPVLEQRSAASLQRAWDGDNDGSPTFINPGISAYTR
jgi:hypothetical protein